MNLIKKLESKDYSDLDNLLDLMQKNIGNLNPYIRDRLIYNAFSDLIITNTLTKPKQLLCFVNC